MNPSADSIITSELLELAARSVRDPMVDPDQRADALIHITQISPTLGLVLVGELLTDPIPAIRIAAIAVMPIPERGLGRVLVERLLEIARHDGLAGIDLEAYHGNAPAALLYRSLGFRRLGRERFYYRMEWEHEEDLP